MTQTLTIGDITVEPGEAKRGMIPVGNDMAGNTGGIPVIVYHGIEDGPSLWLNGATHGDEPEGPCGDFPRGHVDVHLLRLDDESRRARGEGNGRGGAPAI